MNIKFTNDEIEIIYEALDTEEREIASDITKYKERGRDTKSLENYLSKLRLVIHKIKDINNEHS